MGIGLPDFNINKDVFKLNNADGGSIRHLTPPKQLKMAIIPTHEPSNPVLTTLLLNPESLTETKAANWIQHNIPGQSDPLLQWISGTSRTITFTAKVTLDMVENYTVSATGNSNVWSLEIEPELSVIREITDSYNAAILDQLYQVSARAYGSDQNNPTADKVGTRWKQSIQPQLDYYRSLLIPRTGSLKNQLRTPPLVRLYMGTVLGAEPHSANQDFVLASYSFNILQTTPELQPTQADVTFTFIEYNDQSKSYTPRETPDLMKNPAVHANAVNRSPRVLGNVGGFNPVA